MVPGSDAKGPRGGVAAVSQGLNLRGWVGDPTAALSWSADLPQTHPRILPRWAQGSINGSDLDSVAEFAEFAEFVKPLALLGAPSMPFCNKRLRGGSGHGAFGIASQAANRLYALEFEYNTRTVSVHFVEEHMHQGFFFSL